MAKRNIKPYSGESREAHNFLTLIEYGFSINDIERLEKEFDFRFKNQIYITISKRKEIALLKQKLIIAEAVKWGTVGATWDKQGVNQRSYNDFYNKTNKKISVLEGFKEDQKMIDNKWNRIKEEILKRKKKK